MLRIRELRLENNLTQKELAEKISSTSKNIWAYENQISIPPLDVLIKLADFFNCSIDYLANHSDDFGNVVIHTTAPRAAAFRRGKRASRKLPEVTFGPENPCPSIPFS